LYGIGNPVDFRKFNSIEKGQIISRTKLLHQLVQVYIQEQKPILIGFQNKRRYSRCLSSYADEAYRIHFFGDEIEIESFDTKDSKVLENLKN
jgi:excinuclease ABC subunit B